MTAKSSTVREGLFLLILMLVGIAVFYFVLHSSTAQIQQNISSTSIFTIVSLSLTIFLMPLILSLFRVYIIDHTGIQCVWLGRCYRHIIWSDVKDVSRVYLKAGRTELLVATKEAEVIRPSSTFSGFCPTTKEFSRSMHLGNHFFLEDTACVLQCIHCYYGALDYDCLM